MTINRSTLLDLPLPVTGTEAGTWGDVTNNGLTNYLDIAIAGMNSLTSSDFTAGALTIALTEGDASATNIAAGTAQYATIKVSSLAQASTITAPASARSYRIINADATYNLTIKASGQTGVTFLPGTTGLVAFNGTDYEIVGVVGPASATDNAVARFDSTTGQIIQNSVVTIADSTGDISGVGTLNATTADLTNIEVTNIKAKDGTAAGSIADSTGVVTLASSVLTTTDINGGTIDNTAIGGSTASTGAFTTLSASSTVTLSGGTANGVLYLNGSKAATSGSALTFDGLTLSATNTGAATGPTVSSYALQAAGGNNLIANLNANGELYAANTASSKYQYFQAGTLVSISANPTGVNTAALIDFNAYNAAGGATGIFLGAVAGPAGNGPANFVVGRRTGVTSWAEILRIGADTSFTTYPAAGGHTVFNEDGVDADFRVESDTNTHMLFVDAGNNRVGVGTSTPSKVFQTTSAPDTSAPTNGAIFVVSTPGLTPAEVVSISTGIGNNGFASNHAGDWHWRSFWGSVIETGAGGLTGGATNSVVAENAFAVRQYNIGTSSFTNNFVMYTNPTGATVFNEDGLDRDFRVESNDNSAMLFVDAGNNSVQIGGKALINEPSSGNGVMWASPIGANYTSSNGPTTFTIRLSCTSANIGEYLAIIRVVGLCPYTDTGYFRYEAQVVGYLQSAIGTVISADESPNQSFTFSTPTFAADQVNIAVNSNSNTNYRYQVTAEVYARGATSTSTGLLLSIV